MKLKKLMMGVALAASVFSASASNDPKMDKFIDDLMGKMTLQEKLGQLNLPVTGEIVTGQAKSSDVATQIKEGKVGGLFNLKGVDRIREVQEIAVKQSRLHIPLIFGMDVIHGYETVFPIPLSLSWTWDMDAVERSARIAAQEATADGIFWTFSPMLDISREPRWGRTSEGNGEDPYLGSQIGRAMVRGYQGTDLAANNTMAACVKHFALYGAPEAGRDYNTVDMSHLRMFNEYFPPYKAAIDEGALTVMTSFNVVDGIPATGNKWLMTHVLRDLWGFDGFVVTDYTAISEMIAHGMGDLQQVSALALNAGTDMDMVAEGFLGTLEQSLAQGKVTQAQIDAACRRILEAKYKLGLFDDPYRYCDPKRAKKEIFTAENRAEARRIAAESFVLVKNTDKLLPLNPQGKKIAVIGPMANTRANMVGTWSVAARLNDSKSLYEALSEQLQGKATVTWAKGSNLMHDATMEANATMFGREMRDSRSAKEMLDEALAMAADADVIIAAVGEASEMSGESSSISNPVMPDAQVELLNALKATGKPIVMVYFAGRPTIMTWENDNFNTILNVGFGGSEAADAIGDVLLGVKNPSGKFSCTMPKSVGQIPIYYNHLNTGRPNPKWFTKFTSNYLDIDNDPLFPFGYGLSYTTFTYGQPALSSTTLTQGGKITLTVPVTNSGDCDGDEVVQLYIRDLVGSVSRPVQELKGFKRLSLKKGETANVSFDLTVDDLKFYNSELQFVAEPGDFEVMVGTNSRDVQRLRFTLQ